MSSPDLRLEKVNVKFIIIWISLTKEFYQKHALTPLNMINVEVVRQLRRVVVVDFRTIYYSTTFDFIALVDLFMQIRKWYLNILVLVTKM